MVLSRDYIVWGTHAYAPLPPLCLWCGCYCRKCRTDPCAFQRPLRKCSLMTSQWESQLCNQPAPLVFTLIKWKSNFILPLDLLFLTGQVEVQGEFTSKPGENGWEKEPGLEEEGGPRGKGGKGTSSCVGGIWTLFRDPATLLTVNRWGCLKNTWINLL